MTQPIWADWMQRAHDGLDPVSRTRPAGIQELPAYVVRNHIGVSSIEPSPTIDLFPSWYVNPGGDQREKVTRDRVSGKIATECTPPLALEEVTQSDASTFSSDPFVDAGDNTGDTDDVHQCEDIKPTVSLTALDNGNGQYTFQISVGNGTHPISSDKFTGQLNVTIDGQAIPNGSIQIGGPGTYTIDYTSIYDTSKTVQVQITDSVLYTTIDARDIALKTPGASSSGGTGGSGSGGGSGGGTPTITP